MSIKKGVLCFLVHEFYVRSLIIIIIIVIIIIMLYLLMATWPLIQLLNNQGLN